MSEETEGTAQSPASDAGAGATRAPKAKAKKTTAKKATKKTAAKSTAKKTAPKKKTSSKTASKQTTTKKAAAKKSTTKKSSVDDGETAKKPAAKKSTTKKAAPASKKTSSKKSASTRPTAKKSATKKTTKSVSEAAIKELTDGSFGVDDVQAGLSLLLDKAGSFMGKGNLATILAQLLVPKRSTGIMLFPDAQPEEPPVLPSSDEVAEIAAALPTDLPDEQARAVRSALAWLAAGAPQAESSE